MKFWFDFQFLLFLVGLKRDLVNDATARQIDQEAISVAKTINAEFWACSGKFSIVKVRLSLVQI